MNEHGGPSSQRPATADPAALAEIHRKLDDIGRVTEDLSRQLESLHDLREDLVPIAHEGLMIAYRKLNALEQEGGIDHVVHVLETVRKLTRPEVLDLADRTTKALREAPAEPLGRVGMLRSLGDPDVRRGLTMFLGVLRELGREEAPSDRPGESMEADAAEAAVEADDPAGEHRETN